MGSSGVNTVSAAPRKAAATERSSLSRDILAALLCALVPGLGHLFKSNFLRAVIFFACALALLAVDIVFRMPFSLAGLILSAIFTTALALTTACDAFLIRTKEYRKRSSTVVLIVLLPIALALCQARGAFLWRMEGFLTFRVPSGSMEPTIGTGESIAVDTRAYRNHVPEPGDVIVFRHQGIPVVKRVIAVGGDSVEGYGSDVILNGRTQSQPYANLSGVVDPHAFDFQIAKMPPGKMFVMGDHRAVSFDSRDPKFGLIDQQDVIGKVCYIVLSGDRAGQTIE